MFCLSKSSVKVRDSPESKKSTKSIVMCGICSAERNVITLDCKHKCCVKCFHKTKLCSQCEKEQSTCGF